MKIELDTIPVWDALNLNTECPICFLEEKSRSGAIRYYVGPSVMVPEVRVTINDSGFSKANAMLLSQTSNRQGLSLILHTRLKKLRSSLSIKLNGVIKTASVIQKKNVVSSLITSKAELEKKVDEVKKLLMEMETQCLIKNKIKADLGRYVFTFIHLWAKDQEFRKVFQQSYGFCLEHLPLLADQCLRDLSPRDASTFLLEAVTLFEANMDRVEQDILCFSKTFDSTNSHDISGNPEKAIERTLQKIYGAFAKWEEEVKRR